MCKWILHQNLNNPLIFKFFCILSWNIFLPLSIPDEAAATGYCSNYLGYWVFDVDFGDNYMLYQRISERNASLFYEIWVRTGLSRFLGQHWELQQGPGTMLNHAFHFVIHLQPIRWCFWEAVLHRAELSMSKMRVMSTKIFRLNKRKKFLQWGSWGTRTGCPERWWMSYPWRHLRSSCIGLIELYVAGKLDQMAFKGLFQLKWFYGSVILKWCSHPASPQPTQRCSHCFAAPSPHAAHLQRWATSRALLVVLATLNHSSWVQKGEKRRRNS